MIGAFLATARTVLFEATGIEAEVGKLGHALDRSGDRLAVAVPTRGDLASVIWLFPIGLAERAARVMAPGLMFDDELRGHVLTELATILTGRGLATLMLHGVRVELDAPGIVSASPSGIVGALVTEFGAIELAFHVPRAA